MRSCTLLQSLVLAAAFIVAGAEAGAQGNDGRRKTIDAFISRYLSSAISATTPELAGIVDAERAGDFLAVKRACSEVLARPDGSFESVRLRYWVKSLAYMHRARARLKLDEPADSGLEDEIAAAKLGNLQAIQNVSQKLLRKYDDAALPANQRPAASEVEAYYRAGAELGDALSSMMLALGNVPSYSTDDEKLYWFLLGIMRDRGLSAIRRNTMLAAIDEKIGKERLRAILRRFSIVGGTKEAGPESLPERGIAATIFVDSDLRGSFEKTFSWTRPDGAPKESPSTLELFELFKALLGEAGYANAYLIVPGNRKFADRAMISMERPLIEKAIAPGDRVIVRCGALTHIAIVYRTDLAANKIYFADPLAEYWQPSHNSCVSKFDLIEERNKRFLAIVPARDVLNMLDAVIVFRD